MNAPRLLSDTVNGCYENAFMSVWPSSARLNTDVAHSPRGVNYCSLNSSCSGAIFTSFYTQSLERWKLLERTCRHPSSGR